MMRLVEPKISFHELYFREHSKIVRAAVKMPLAYLGGAKSVAGVEAVMADGFDAVVMGRALLHDAALVNKFRDGTATVSGCNACNHCVVMMYTDGGRSEEHTSELKSLMRISYAVFCLKKQKK